MSLKIKKATKAESKLRMALTGPSGAGKTFTALSIGSELGKKILVVDTESGSASKYADLFEFDVIELSEFPPENFIEAIKVAEANSYEVIIIDSLSHEWNGKGGVLEIHESETKRGGNSYTAWAKVTPRHNALIQAVIQSKLHVISTMRAKTDYSMEKDDKGRTQIKTVGLAPVQRDGMEYEYDVVANIDIDNNFIVQKTRCPMLSGKVFNKAGLQVAEILKVWLQGEKPVTVKLPPPVTASAPAATATNEQIPSAVPSESQNCEEEWNRILNEPEQSPVTPETRGKLLAQAGHVAREGNGYSVSETIEGQITKYKITREQGITKCTCSEYVRESRTNNQYFCPHKWALRFTVDQKQAAN